MFCLRFVILGFRRLLVLMLWSNLIAAPAQAQMSCGLGDPMDRLLGQLEQLHNGTNPLGVSATTSIARLGRAASLPDIRHRLNELQRPDLLHSVHRIIAASGSVHTAADLEPLRQDVAFVVIGMRAACSKLAPAPPVPSDPSSELTAKEAVGPGSNVVNHRTRSMQKLGYAVGLMLALISVLILANYIYSVVFSYWFSRRSCQIAAHVQLNGKLYNGLILVLGRRGCSFKPASGSDLDAIERRALSENSYVIVDDYILPASVYRVSAGTCGLLFETQTALRTHNELLAFSSRATKPLKNRPPPGNIQTRKVSAPKPAFRGGQKNVAEATPTLRGVATTSHR